VHWESNLFPLLPPTEAEYETVGYRAPGNMVALLAYAKEHIFSQQRKW